MHDSINHTLLTELSGVFSSPEAGIQEIRNVMLRFGVSLPVIDDLDEDGDEMLFDLNELDTGEEIEQDKLYVIYYLTDDDDYEFYAEVMDEYSANQIMSDEEEDEEEQ